MMTTSSAAYGTIKQNAKFKFGESTLPYYADVQGAPQNTIIGGASLWVMAGKKKDEYKAVAKFLNVPVAARTSQAEFSQETGYVPITIAAYELTKKSGFYEKNPGTDVAVQQMIVKTTSNSRGVRAGNMPQIRDAMDEELEAVWAGKKTAKQGLDDAVKRGNEIIDRFNKANKGTSCTQLPTSPPLLRARGRGSASEGRWRSAPASSPAGCRTR
jgi:sn-glycerol 3-phosphate transport system substrate-binding protein